MKAANLVELRVFCAIAGEWGKLARQTRGPVPVCQQQSKGANKVFKTADYERRNVEQEVCDLQGPVVCSKKNWTA
jgi:hypothetical protein